MITTLINGFTELVIWLGVGLHVFVGLAVLVCAVPMIWLGISIERKKLQEDKQ